MADIRAIPIERRFQLLVEAVVDYALFLLDSDGIVTSWNSGAQRIKGYTADEIIGTHFSRFYTREDRQRGIPEKALQIAAETGRCEAEGWRVKRDGSTFWASVVIDAIYENDELLGFAKITRDISERKQSEKRLLEAKEQLLHAQKMESLGQLIGGIAHDFNNLLTIILSGSQMAERIAEGNVRLLAIMGHIRHAVERGEKLTRQLLGYSRRQMLKPQVLDVSRFLQSTTENILRSLRDDIDVTLDIEEGLPSVEADPKELELALLSIAVNAREAMPMGGKLEVRAAKAPLTNGGLGLSGQFVSISLADNGVGMSPETKTRAIEPFFTTKPAGSGSGLGLSQAYGFSKQSGGTMQIESALGQGTAVSLYLPTVTRTQPYEHERPLSVGRAVLIIEDEVLVAEMARAILADAGYAVEVAHDANKALSILRSGKKVDAVFSDVMMPGGLNGDQLADIIKNEFPELPVLLTTGYSHAADKDILRTRPVLQKPYDEGKLIRALNEILPEGL